MTWTVQTDVSNTWDAYDSSYVVSGYWIDGYVVSNENSWNNDTPVTNTWNRID
jgi:hypothetical protein